MDFFGWLVNKPKRIASPQEQLLDDWHYVHKRFFQENTGGMMNVSQTQIPGRLHRIVKILSDEESKKKERKREDGVNGKSFIIRFFLLLLL